MKLSNRLAIVALVLTALVLTTAAGLRRFPIYATSNSLVQSGQSVSGADGTVSNSFTTAYGSAPKVIVSQFGTVTSTNMTVTNCTTTGFTISCGKSGVTNHYIVIGTP